MGAPSESHVGDFAYANWLLGALSREIDSTLGQLWASGRDQLHFTPALGGVWDNKDREQGLVSHSSVDTEAHWTKSGWHGWVYGWKLHLAAIVATVWIQVAAEFTPANIAENQHCCAECHRKRALS